MGNRLILYFYFFIIRVCLFFSPTKNKMTKCYSCEVVIKPGAKVYTNMKEKFCPECFVCIDCGEEITGSYFPGKDGPDDIHCPECKPLTPINPATIAPPKRADSTVAVKVGGKVLSAPTKRQPVQIRYCERCGEKLHATDLKRPCASCGAVP